MSNKVICCCSHLGVEIGDVGEIQSSNFEELIIKWENGNMSREQYDDIRFITKRNKMAYIVESNGYRNLFLNKKESTDFIKTKRKAELKILEIKFV